MRCPIVLTLALTLTAGAASASSLQLCDENGPGLIGCTPSSSKVKLVGYHGAVPIPGDAPVVVHGGADLFLLGLGLVAGGLVLGAAGFAVLLVCHGPTDTEGAASCYSPTMTIVGW